MARFERCAAKLTARNGEKWDKAANPDRISERRLQPLNEGVLGQIRKYAKAVALDTRFQHCNVEWDFVAVSNEFTRGAELQARMASKPRPDHGARRPIKIRIWVKTRGQIIQEAEGRLTFLGHASNIKRATRKRFAISVRSTPLI